MSILVAVAGFSAAPVCLSAESGGYIHLPDGERQPCDMPSDHPGAWIDQNHEALSEGVCGVAMWFDNFFGDERADAESVDRYIRVITGLDWREGDSPSVRVRVRARIALPRLRQHVHLILSDEEDNDVTRTVPDFGPDKGKIIQATNAEKYALAVRWTPILGGDSSFSTKIGLHFGAPLKPYISSRYRYTYGISETLLARLTQSVFWKNQEGFGENTRFDLEHLINPFHLLRGSLSGTYSEISNGLEWSAGLSLYRNVSQKQAWSYNLSLDAVTKPVAEVRSYTASVRYRRNIFRPWLFVEVEPSLSWRKDEGEIERHRDFGIGIYLEAHFGRKRDPFDMF